jgi:pimeloyl-ACP methyl ester carboxylesterase
MIDRVARVNGIKMHYVREGEGPPLFLLHGWPQTLYEWRLVAPALARHYTVIAPDLRGYGGSDKPAGGYDKRTMATDIRALARHLGYERFRLVGHDRGARVAYRYALDWEDDLERLVLLDSVPTRHIFEHIDKNTALTFWHFFFHQVPDLPEVLVGANVEAYLRHFYHAGAFQRGAFTPEVIAHYVHAYSQSGALRGGFNDYRAAATIDLEHDAADAGRRLKVPLLVLWGAESRTTSISPVLEIWRGLAEQVEGEAIPECGHYLPEEQPDLVATRLLRFLA